MQPLLLLPQGLPGCLTSSAHYWATQRLLLLLQPHQRMLLQPAWFHHLDPDWIAAQIRIRIWIWIRLAAHVRGGCPPPGA